MSGSDAFSTEWFIFLGIWLAILAIVIGSWQLSSKIQQKYLRWFCKIMIGLFAGVSALLFFGTCFGIGYAGCG